MGGGFDQIDVIPQVVVMSECRGWDFGFAQQANWAKRMVGPVRWRVLDWWRLSLEIGVDGFEEVEKE